MPKAEHSHPHAELSQHTHTHTQTKAVLNRLSRAIGHLESVKRMVENGQDCAEVLIQLAAVKSAINNTGKLILKDGTRRSNIHRSSESGHRAIYQIAASRQTSFSRTAPKEIRLRRFALCPQATQRNTRRL